jgi:hypothetical protein
MFGTPSDLHATSTSLYYIVRYSYSVCEKSASRPIIQNDSDENADERLYHFCDVIGKEKRKSDENDNHSNLMDLLLCISEAVRASRCLIEC